MWNIINFFLIFSINIKNRECLSLSHCVFAILHLVCYFISLCESKKTSVYEPIADSIYVKHVEYLCLP